MLRCQSGSRGANRGLTELGVVAFESELHFLELPLLCLKPLQRRLQLWGVVSKAETGGGAPYRSDDSPFGPRLSTSPSWSFAMWHSMDG